MLDRKILTDVHRYWFGDDAANVPKEKFDLWFSAKPEFDAEIRERYEKYLAPAKATDWNLATLSQWEQVGLVILLDQFPRNIYRSTGDAFAYDEKARTISNELLKDGVTRFHPSERPFVMLPFMHSELMADQDRSVALYANELAAAPPERVEGARMAFDFAYKHWMLIRKFGRFPHRNAMMGRQSTPEEIEFLKGGRGF
jgi:uncharacterized protein (DUF924 family)